MNVTLFTMPACGPCAATKHALTSRSIPFTAVDLTADPEALARVQALGHRTAPVVLVEDTHETTHWGGFQLDRITDLAARLRMQGEAA